MPITDLLDRVSFSPVPRSREEDGRHAPVQEATERTFEIELPTVERVGALDPVVLPPAFVSAAKVLESQADEGLAPELQMDPAPLRWLRALPILPPLPPLPSWAIAVIGGLSLLCLALTAALAVAVAEPTLVEAVPAAADTPEEPSPEADPSAEPTATPASFSAEPTAIPVELLTRLEEASDQPLDVELTRLLEAIQFGFGRRSAQLEPTLRSYVYRMSSRFEWNPDFFRVAVTAPDPALATARAALLERLFENAVAAGRLDVGSGIGPNALTLVTE